MNQQSMLYHGRFSAFKPLLIVVALIAALAGCKPSAASSTRSPLPTPSPLPLSTNSPEKPIATFIESTPLSSFLPAKNSTPAGTGAIINWKMIPPFYVHDFLVENVWYKDSEGGTLRTYVYGGYIPGPGGEITQQGVVVVQILKMDLHGDIQQVYYRQFPTKTQSGSVHVTDASGERLILQSTDGTTFYFDVPTRQFAPSLDAVVPTSTPGFVDPLATPQQTAIP
jgi:hypothetical protein